MQLKKHFAADVIIVYIANHLSPSVALSGLSSFLTLRLPLALISHLSSICTTRISERSCNFPTISTLCVAKCEKHTLGA